MDNNDQGLLGSLSELIDELEIAIEEVKILMIHATSKFLKMLLIEILEDLEARKKKAIKRIMEVNQP